LLCINSFLFRFFDNGSYDFVLLTGLKDNKICIFDPNWDNVSIGLKRKITGVQFFENVSDYNALAEITEFFQEKKQKKVS